MLPSTGLHCRVHAQLRSATRCVHSRIEKRLPFNEAGFDRGAYRNLLAAYHGFYSPVERELGPHAGAIDGLHWQRRTKAALLKQDLRWLGVPNDALQQLAVCDRLPQLPTPEHALGCLYVLEGATLGGQVVQRLLCKRLGNTVAGALAFFDSYGSEVDAQWRSFLRCLGLLNSSASVDAAQEAAIETFERFENWLQRCEVLR